MALGIDNDEAQRLARELAAITGESVAEAVVVSLRERLARLRAGRENRPLAERLMEIGRRCSRRAVLDDRTPDEIMGYDDDGLPR